MATIPFNPMLPGNWLMRSVNDMPLEPAVDRNPYAPQMPPEMARYWQAAQLTGGNNSLEDDTSIRRQYLLGIQRAAQQQAAQSAVQRAIAERKQQQWLSGERTIGDQSPGDQLTPAYYAAMAAQPQRVNSNGVNSGIAFRGGQPVGFAGPLSEAGGIGVGGFTDNVRSAFQRDLMKRVAAMPSPGAAPRGVVAPQQMVGQVPAFNLSEPISAVPRRTPLLTEQGLPDDTPAAASANARANAFANATGLPVEGATIPERQQSKKNTAAGIDTRVQVKKFEEALPAVLPELTAEAGIEVDEDILAATLVAEDGLINELKRFTPLLAQKLGIDPKILLRWAQDRKKAKA